MALYRPTVFGVVASVIFFVLMLVALKDREWLDAVGWALVGVAFALTLAPRRIFSSQTSIIAGGALVIGSIIVLLDAAERLT